MRILVVEDEPKMADVLHRGMTRAGLAVDVTDPTVNALNQAKFKGKTRLSYPSKHAALSAAAVAVLRHYEPSREGEYRWMADQVDFSRLYAGGHYLSDLTAGAFLGTAIGEYSLHRAAA